MFVVPEIDLAAAAAGSVLLVDGPEGRHAVSVRRIAVGEQVALVDGAGRRARAMVGAIVDKQSFEAVLDTIEQEPEPAPRVVAVQALAKGDRGEVAVELLTEIGVDVIVPWAAAHCVAQWKAERADRGRQRWLDAARAAAKQSRRARFPQVEPLATTADVVARITAAAGAVVLHETAEASISGVTAPESGELVVVVGPEGGISPEELAAFVGAGATAVRLGPSVLRTSSAGIAAVAALLAPTGRWTVAEAPKVEG